VYSFIPGHAKDHFGDNAEKVTGYHALVVHPSIGAAAGAGVAPGKKPPVLCYVAGESKALAGEPFANRLAEADIIVNALLQDPNAPVMFLDERHTHPNGGGWRLKPGALIVDVSCDAGMAFPFAKPTSFKQPTFTVPVGPAGSAPAMYYSVDHTPTYLYDAASWDISVCVTEHLPALLKAVDSDDFFGVGTAGDKYVWGAETPATDKLSATEFTLSRAVELLRGRVTYPPILEFQRHRISGPPRRKPEAESIGGTAEGCKEGYREEIIVVRRRGISALCDRKDARRCGEDWYEVISLLRRWRSTRGSVP